jgi:hypothetical protein
MGYGMSISVDGCDMCNNFRIKLELCFKTIET